MSLADKHKLTIDDSLARLVSRAANSRGLKAADLMRARHKINRKICFARQRKCWTQ
ncbi:MAG: hypothetical protein WKF71_06340 [Pyrinomonadaceae bacterium]